ATLANGGSGVLIDNFAAHNTVGGTAAGAGNTIAFNSGKGVVVGSDPGDAGPGGNSILGNHIFANAGGGLDLGDDGVTANGGNPRSLPNHGQNTPLLFTPGGGTVTGELHGVAGTTFRLEFFATGAGSQTFLGAADVTTDALG